MEGEGYGTRAWLVVSPAYAGASLKEYGRRVVRLELQRCLPRLCGGLIEGIRTIPDLGGRTLLSPPLMRGPH